VHCEDDVIGAMKTAWAQTSNGTSGTEAGFQLRGTVENYNIVPAAYSNEQGKLAMPAPTPDTFAIFHVHPNRSAPQPSDADKAIGQQFSVDMYTMGRSGLYVYDPSNNTTKELRPGLEWTKPCPE
jgi:hypothetical protein